LYTDPMIKNLVQDYLLKFEHKEKEKEKDLFSESINKIKEVKSDKIKDNK